MRAGGTRVAVSWCSGREAKEELRIFWDVSKIIPVVNKMQSLN